MSSNDYVMFTIRIPRPLEGVIKQQARKSRRTRNTEVIFQLERVFQKEIQEFRNQAEVAGGVK